MQSVTQNNSKKGINYFAQGQKLMQAHSYRAAIQAFKLSEMRGQEVKPSLEAMQECYTQLDLPQMADVVAERLRLMN